MMNIKPHGEWKRYRPDPLPEDVPANALFARRADGTDWYDYVNSGANFASGSVKLTVVDGVVAAAVTDATMLFPGGAVVLEISGVPANDPQQAFGGQLYDGKVFNPPPPTRKDQIAELLKRVEALEKAGK